MTALRGISGGAVASEDIGSIQISGAPVLATDFHKVAMQAGYGDDDKRLYQVNRPDKRVFLGLPKTDLVGDLLGLNLLYDDNPLARFFGAIFSVGSLFTDDSPHSNYACWVCNDGVGEQGRKIRESLPKPVFIDKDGNRQ